MKVEIEVKAYGPDVVSCIHREDVEWISVENDMAHFGGKNVELDDVRVEDLISIKFVGK